MFQIMWYKLIVSEKKIRCSKITVLKAEFGTVSSLCNFLLDKVFFLKFTELGVVFKFVIQHFSIIL